MPGARMRLRPAEIVIWSDDALVVVNKPAGALAIPSAHEPGSDLLAMLQPALGRLWVVHRLDRDTSGVLVLARSAEAHRALNHQFASRAVTKQYHALVRGMPPWEKQRIELPLRMDGDRRHRTVTTALGSHSPGKPAVTCLRVIERFQQYALLEAIPQTGRTHQIRTHLAAVGLPIVADALYGDGLGLLLSAIKPAYRGSTAAESPLLARLALHAVRLELQHPISHESLVFTAPYPKDLEAALRQLRKLTNGLSGPTHSAR